MCVEAKVATDCFFVTIRNTMLQRFEALKIVDANRPAE